jgi:hypothetical protein
MRKGGDYQFESDIGYGVNHANNGVWLPGNYAVREDNPEFDFKTWTQYLPAFQQTYVRSAMASASGRMFHDSHRKYNGRVKDTLNSIAAKLTKPVKTNCPICDRPLDDRKNRPPYGLVARLDFVSGEHRNMVVNPTAKTVTAGYFTSSKGGRVVLSPLP